ncbi:hypothetical protein EI546_10270 [Aequorivita sp. H23M31]|uniref:Lipoprotein n=1 Tax=Aequorivita ciconiae TaxID=2494375 RepID=A0A410G4B7_9FLAO|nr:hypothetical protein [Aequorivita sp. H23M31]QAA82081.1 hypothetical protein EI546_10270 [Aequorivita sp. H23M31]
MKNFILLLLVIFSFPFLNSCTVKDENLVLENYSLKAEKQREFQKSLLIGLRHARSEDFHGKVDITESRIENIEGIFYLRTFYNNGFVSTTLLKKGGDDDDMEETDTSLEIIGTTCTSSSCAGSGGCMPKLNGYCTPCTLGTKDCTRSTGL